MQLNIYELSFFPSQNFYMQLPGFEPGYRAWEARILDQSRFLIDWITVASKELFIETT